MAGASPDPWPHIDLPLVGQERLFAPDELGECAGQPGQSYRHCAPSKIPPPTERFEDGIRREPSVNVRPVHIFGFDDTVEESAAKFARILWSTYCDAHAPRR